MNEPDLVLITSDGYFKLPLGESISLGIVDMEDNSVVIPVKCDKCDRISIFEESLDKVEVDHRQMGNEYWYSASNEIKCFACQNLMAVQVDVTDYVGGIMFCDYETHGCSLEKINGFENILISLYRLQQPMIPS